MLQFTDIPLNHIFTAYGRNGDSTWHHVFVKITYDAAELIETYFSDGWEDAKPILWTAGDIVANHFDELVDEGLMME